MSEPKSPESSPDTPKEGVKITGDGKIEIIDPSLLDAISGGAGEEAEEIQPDIIMNYSC